MDHIDEGTIHAWLDGALPVADGARVESHVADCSACAAAVAEARGLIAASSRILSALDDVPGGVIPLKVPTIDAVATPHASMSASPESAALGRVESATTARMADAGVRTARVGPVRVPPVRTIARRPWLRRSQWAAAAGISFLAVAASVVWQRSGARSVMDVDRARSIEATTLPPDVAGGADAAGRSADDGSAAAAPRQSSADVATPSKSAPASNELKSAVVADANTREAPRQPREAPIPVTPPPSAVRAAIADQSRTEAARDTVVAARALALNADAIARSESARVTGERDAQRKASAPVIQGVVVTGETAANRSAALRGAAANRRDGDVASPVTLASLAGCYQLQPPDGARLLQVGALLQLDVVAEGSDAARPAYVARDLTTAPTASQGVEGPLRWTLSSTGQVTLVRGEGDGAQRLTLELATAPGHPAEGGVVRAVRTPCPSR